MKRYVLDVTCRVHVQIDEQKFTPEKMADFNSCISDFGIDHDAFERHAKHIASQTVLNGWEFEGHNFFEGYGFADEAGVLSLVENSVEIDVVIAPSPTADDAGGAA